MTKQQTVEHPCGHVGMPGDCAKGSELRAAERAFYEADMQYEERFDAVCSEAPEGDRDAALDMLKTEIGWFAAQERLKAAELSNANDCGRSPIVVECPRCAEIQRKLDATEEAKLALEKALIAAHKSLSLQEIMLIIDDALDGQIDTSIALY